MAIKSRAQLEKTKSLVEQHTEEQRGGNVIEIRRGDEITEIKKRDMWQIADWKPSKLKKLTPDQLEEQWWAIERQTEAIGDQARMMIWFICLRLRQAFDSDRLLGEHINELAKRDPNHPLVQVKPQTRNKWMRAALWCEKMKIDSLPAAGLSQTAVFLLSSEANKDWAAEIYKEIKGQNVAVSVVEKMIADKKVVLTIEKQPQTDDEFRFEDEKESRLHDIKKLYVEHGIAVEVGGKTSADSTDEDIFDFDERSEPIDSAIAERSHPGLSLSATDKDAVVTTSIEESQYKRECREKLEADQAKLLERNVLVKQLAALDASFMSDEQILAEWAIIEQSYGRPDVALTRLHKERMVAISAAKYPGRA